MINFGSIPTRSGTWSWFKPLIASKSIVLQTEETSDTYTAYGYDQPEALSCTIWKGVVPDSAVTGGYSQAQNDADKADFETNFLPYANRTIDNIPSNIITTPIKTAGGSANLAQNGAATPVVFEYNPPANYDIEINHLSFLFEDTTAFSFGNKFVLTGIATLTNGLLLECRANGQAFTWQNSKRTRDLIEICESFDLITGTVNFLRIDVHLPASLRLARAGTYGTADFIRVTVRDDLSSIDFAEAYIHGVKI